MSTQLSLKHFSCSKDGLINAIRALYGKDPLEISKEETEQLFYHAFDKCPEYLPFIERAVKTGSNIKEIYSIIDDFSLFLEPSNKAETSSWAKRHIRRLNRDDAFISIKETYPETVQGIEFKSETRDQWAFISPDLDTMGYSRISIFDEGGFSGHSAYESEDVALNEMVRVKRFNVPDPGALMLVQNTERFLSGCKATFTNPL